MVMPANSGICLDFPHLFPFGKTGEIFEKGKKACISSTYYSWVILIWGLHTQDADTDICFVLITLLLMWTPQLWVTSVFWTAKLPAALAGAHHGNNGVHCLPRYHICLLYKVDVSVGMPCLLSSGRYQSLFGLGRRFSMVPVFLQPCEHCCLELKAKAHVQPHWLLG